MRYSKASTISLLTIALGGSALMGVACGGDDSGGNKGGSGGSGTGGTANPGSGGTGNAAGSSASGGGGGVVTGKSICNPAGPPWPKGDAGDLIIDNFDDADEKLPEPRVGQWAFSADASPQATATAGEAKVAINGAIKPVDGMLKLKGDGYGKFLSENPTTGDSVWGWGAAIVASLNKTNSNCPYDGSAYGGIKFKIKGTASTKLYVQIAVPEVVPIPLGGTCVSPGDAMCFDKHKVIIDAVPGTQEEYVLPWGEFAQSGWGTPAEFDPSKISTIEFAFPQLADKTVKKDDGTEVTFDVEIDDLEFVPPGTPAKLPGGSTGAGGAGNAGAGGNGAGGAAGDGAGGAGEGGNGG